MILDAEQFDELVDQALAGIPARLREQLRNVAILVQDRNPEEPDLLGLYVGVPLTERTTDYSGVLPDQILLYRDALLDVCADRDELVHEITVTVVHEVAHYFGIDDERLEELGWG